MSIRAKLLLNVSTVIAVLIAIVLASVRGMGSVQENVWALTQKSTPFQMKTVELEKAIQTTVGAMAGANGARGLEQLKASRAKADGSLAEVKRLLTELRTLSGGATTGVYEELKSTADELIGVADLRLKAQDEAEAAGRTARERLKDALAQLAALDARVERLQRDAVTRFQQSMKATKESSTSLRDIEALASSVPSIQLFAFQSVTTDNRYDFHSLLETVNAEFDKASKNPHFKKSSETEGLFRKLLPKIRALAEARGAYLAEANESGRRKVKVLASETEELFSELIISLDADREKLTNRYETERERQEQAFAVLTAASAVLAGDSELGSVGRAMESLASRVFLASSAAEMDALETELKALLERAHAIGKRLSSTLSSLKAKEEAVLAGRALAALTSIHGLIAGEAGMAARIRRSLELNEKGRQMSARLDQTAARQTKRGEANVLTARGDQEAAIRSVNDSLRNNKNLVIWSGALAVLFGLGFGFWIYRSVSRPLRALSGVAAEVERTGDFSLRSEARGRDEVSMTVRAFNSLLDTLGRAIGDVNRVMGDVARGDLRSSIEVEAKGDLDSLKQSVNHSVAALSRTIRVFRDQSKAASSASGESAVAVDQVATSTRQQLDAVSRLAAAMQQTSVTMTDIAGSTDVASHRARSSADLVRRGRREVEVMAEAMTSISQNSERISGITGMIIDVADQTNLLALNAAIEAARAGDHGRGFAVVAEEVSKLSDRVAALAKDISSVVGTSVGESARAARQAGEIRTEMERIEKASGEIEDMLQRVAAAVEEQSTTVAAISGDVGTLNDLAQTNAAVSDRVAGSLARLAQTADAATREVERFQT